MPWVSSLPASALLTVARCDASTSEELRALSLHLGTSGPLRSILQVGGEAACMTCSVTYTAISQPQARCMECQAGYTAATRTAAAQPV